MKIRWLHIDAKWSDDREGCGSYMDFEGFVSPKRVMNKAKKEFDVWKKAFEWIDHPYQNDKVWTIFLHYVHMAMDSDHTPSSHVCMEILTLLGEIFPSEHSPIALMNEGDER